VEQGEVIAKNIKNKIGNFQLLKRNTEIV